METRNVEIETRQFGLISISEDKIINVPKGIPGFPKLKRYILLDHDELQPFVTLQSVEEAGLSFFLMDPFLFKSDYDVNIGETLLEMGWENDGMENIFLYVILNVTDNDPKKITANLMGPVLINIKKNQAVQMMVSDRRYSHKYRIFNEEDDDGPDESGFKEN